VGYRDNNYSKLYYKINNFKKNIANYTIVLKVDVASTEVRSIPT
jgi:hypothetical protein